MTWEKSYRLPNLDLWDGLGAINTNDKFYQIIECLDANQLPALAKDKAKFAFLGFCCDEGVRRNNGRPGASTGPEAIRKQLAKLSYARKDVDKIYDIGDIACYQHDLLTAQNTLRDVICYARERHIVPIVLGGGHETAYAHYLGFADQLEGFKFGILNFDAHFDLRDVLQDGVGTSGSPFTQIYLDCKDRNQDFKYNVIGIQPAANSVLLYDKACELGVKFVEANDIHTNGLASSQELITNLLKEVDLLYLTICLDVFSQAHAPGVSAPQPLGLEPWHVVQLLEPLVRSNKVFAFDIVELNPKFDNDNCTAKLAANILLEILKDINCVI